MMIVVSPHVSWSPVEGELVLFNGGDGTYHFLNGSAAAIWRAIASGLNEEQAIESLTALYGSPGEAITSDIQSFIADALGKGLLVKAEQRN